MCALAHASFSYKSDFFEKKDCRLSILLHPRRHRCENTDRPEDEAMRYLLLIHASEKEYAQLSPEEVARAMESYGAFTNALREAGALGSFARLRPSVETHTIRVRNGKPVTTDGPFTETKEHLGGFYLIDVANVDEALAWAAQCPGAHHGTIEVRPIWEKDS
jgi:hypothetical protein